MTHLPQLAHLSCRLGAGIMLLVAALASAQTSAPADQFGVIATVELGTGPLDSGHLALSSDGRTAVAALPAQGALALARFAARQSSLVPIEGTPISAAITPDGSQAVVANRDLAALQLINLSDGTVTSTFPLVAPAGGTAITPDGQRVLATLPSQNGIITLDLNNGMELARWRIGNRPTEIILSRNGQVALVLNRGDNSLSVVGVGLGNELQRITLESGDVPVALAMSPNGRSGLVRNQRGVVRVYDLSNGFQAASLVGGLASGGVAVTADGQRVLVTSGPSNSVGVMNLLTSASVTNISVGQEPLDIATSADNRFAAVLNASGTLNLLGLPRGCLGVRTQIDSTPIACGDHLTGSLPDPVSTGLFEFAATQGTVVTIEVRPQPGSVLNPRVLLSLVGDGGRLRAGVAGDRDSGPAGGAWITAYPLPLTGTYLIEVIAETSVEGDLSYLVFLEREDSAAVQAGLAAAVQLEMGGTFSGTISAPGELDYYRLSGQQGEVIQAEVAAVRLASALDPILSVFDSQGRLIARNNNAIEGIDARIAVRIPSDGMVLLRVESADHSQGGEAFFYELTITGGQQ
ncbi:MAG: YncE family protein [Deinococcus sp.]|nr:YncE family protein [Deinococcus sp.]